MISINTTYNNLLRKEKPDNFKRSLKALLEENVKNIFIKWNQSLGYYVIVFYTLRLSFSPSFSSPQLSRKVQAVHGTSNFVVKTYVIFLFHAQIIFNRVVLIIPQFKPMCVHKNMPRN